MVVKPLSQFPYVILSIIRFVVPNYHNGHSCAGHLFLFGVFLVVFLDGSGTVARHFSDMGDGRACIEFAGDKCASCRVPSHFFVDAQILANLVQCLADEG